MKAATIRSFFENSNQNGFGFLTVVVLFYLFVFFFIQFFQHKKRYYLLYSLYALVNAASLLKYIDGVFFSDFFDTSLGRVYDRAIHYPSQLFGSLFFSYFIIEIMQLRKTFPKSIKVIDVAYLVSSIIFLVLWGVYMNDYSSYLIDYFHAYVFLILSYIVFFAAFYMVAKGNMAIKGYILSGMSVLVISYFAISVMSMRAMTANRETLYIYYIGILIESLLFALAIGLEQKMVYREKALVQKKYIQQLEENQTMKESINRTLSEELLQTKTEIEDLSAEAQRERTEKLTMKFENKFAQLRLNALRSQMSPHFIFNALNSIKSYFIDNDQEKAIFYLSKFSKLIRCILESSRAEEISLKEELDILEMYIAIENDRFKNDIQFKIASDEGIELENIMIPALILQPFIENAIWHGLSTKKGEKLLNLSVGYSKLPNTIEISIADNGVGRRVSEDRNLTNPLKKESLGLTLTRDRLDLFSKKFQKHYSYRIEDIIDETIGDALGTRVVVQIPNA
ncbi:sensor histidine kinase [Maribacter thermophilus]|uniref:sensor histidine kinase n=1 Tax=Maribacter thermophilus TaxID=1197874 RepID=UPI00069A33A8|nr:histidine kinase [Maribacter thermophilus]